MTLQEKYNNLQNEVESELIDRIENSTYESEHYHEKAIRVNVYDYTELAIIDDRLTFIDSDGHLYADCTLEDLIDIINIFDNN